MPLGTSFFRNLWLCIHSGPLRLVFTLLSIEVVENMRAASLAWPFRIILAVLGG